MGKLIDLIKSNNNTRTFKEHKEQTAKAAPFIQWVGGKRQLLSDYSSLFPTDFKNYFEPFAGGAAVFYHLREIHGDSVKYHLSDLNSELIITYKAVQENPEQVADILKDLNSRHSKEFYYQVRNIDRVKVSTNRYKKLFNVKDCLPSEEIAARFLYLNKTCFNSIYRVNKDNLFNVPIGTSLKKNVSDNGRLKVCSEALENVDIRTCSYLEIESSVGAKDLVYLDPPYAPTSATSNFVSYTKEGFDVRHQKELRDFCDRIGSKGAYFMVSNSNCELIRDLYKSYNQHTFIVNRNLNSKANKRSKSAEEILITNF